MCRPADKGPFRASATRWASSSTSGTAAGCGRCCSSTRCRRWDCSARALAPEPWTPFAALGGGARRSPCMAAAGREPAARRRGGSVPDVRAYSLDRPPGVTMPGVTMNHLSRRLVPVHVLGFSLLASSPVAGARGAAELHRAGGAQPRGGRQHQHPPGPGRRRGAARRDPRSREHAARRADQALSGGAAPARHARGQCTRLRLHHLGGRLRPDQQPRRRRSRRGDRAAARPPSAGGDGRSVPTRARMSRC